MVCAEGKDLGITEVFFELLQIVVGTRKELSSTPSASDWRTLYEMSRQQALTAIVFSGVNLAGYGLDKRTFFGWLGMVAAIGQCNKQLNEECVRLTEKLRQDGFYCCVLKGQSNLEYYPEALKQSRTPGDIDILLRSVNNPASVAIPIRYCRKMAKLLNKKLPHVTYHHADLAWDGFADVEAHYRATFLCSPWRNRRLQLWLERHMPWDAESTTSECGFPIPSITYNTIFQLLHIYKHIFETGIGLRQLLDLYFVLTALNADTKCSKQEIMHRLERFGMKKFTGAVMYVLQTVFAMPDQHLLCQPDEKEGAFLLSEIMMAGNFGQYDNRIKHVDGQVTRAIEKTKHNLRLLTHYPEEVLWEPVFRLWHWGWRKLELWRF